MLERALSKWSVFPVSASPRPIILLGGYTVDPEYGFPDNASKEAYNNGEITAPSSWPSSPTSSMSYPIISASTAFRTLTSTSGTSGPPVPSPEVTGVHLGSGKFLTDRGYKELPAWLFSISGVQNPAEVLAVSQSAIYSPPGTTGGYSPAGASATIGTHGRTMVVNFIGAQAGTGPCTASYTVSVKESKQAVAVAVRGHSYGSGPQACLAMGYSRHVTTQLATALGARVVVDTPSNGAMAVTVAGSSTSQAK